MSRSFGITDSLREARKVLTVWRPLLGIVASCRSHGVESRAYLTWTFTRLGTHRDVLGLTPAEMTPAAFKRSQTR